MAREVDTPSGVDTDRQQLTDEEQGLLDRAFERGLEDTRDVNTETVREKLDEYRHEIEVGAEIARSQFDQMFGGVNPSSGRYAISRAHSGYFGWDSWENAPSLTGGQLNDWLDDDTPDNLTSGTSGFGSPLKVGEEAVHVIVGFGTYHDSPKVSAIKPEVNEEPRPSVKVKYEWTKTDTQIKWLDRALILPENALFAAQLYAENGGTDFPYPVGVSFVKNRAAQIADPSEMTDDSASTSDNIVAQS